MNKTFCILLYAMAMLMQHSCSDDSYQVKVSGPVTIGTEWVELTPKSALRAEKDLQMIVLELAEPFKFDLSKEGTGPNQGMGILMPDGEVINPEIEVIDEHGNKFNLVYAGARGTEPSPVYNLPYPNKWPRDREYKTVRIRSSRPIECKAILWYCESRKNLH